MTPLLFFWNSLFEAANRVVSQCCHAMAFLEFLTPFSAQIFDLCYQYLQLSSHFSFCQDGVNKKMCPYLLACVSLLTTSLLSEIEVMPRKQSLNCHHMCFSQLLEPLLFCYPTLSKLPSAILILGALPLWENGILLEHGQQTL